MAPVGIEEQPDGTIDFDAGKSRVSRSNKRRMPRAWPAFHFCCSIGELIKLPGDVLVPDLPQLPHIEGVNGADGEGQLGGAVSVAENKGRHVIPHSAIKIVAHGKRRKTYLKRKLHGHTAKNEPIWCYYSVFRKPIFVGNRFLHMDFDAKAWHQFRLDAMKWLLDRESIKGLDKIPPAYRMLAEKGIRDEIRSLQGRSGESVKARLGELKSRLPAELEAADE